MSLVTRVLVVEDEPPIVELVHEYFAREGWEVIAVGDGPSAVEAVRERAPDVVILDVMLPGFDGFEALRRIRMFSDAYVLMLTARAEEVDRIVGLTVGADDYLLKPFSPRELVARARGLLRRPRTVRPGASEQLQLGDLVIDERRRVVSLRSVPVRLTSTEFNMLLVLATEPGVVFSRQKLLDRVWGLDYVGDEHVVDVHLGNLRRKLGDHADDPQFIETVRGVGLRFREAS